jgi:hypothetical protein
MGPFSQSRSSGVREDRPTAWGAYRRTQAQSACKRQKSDLRILQHGQSEDTEKKSYLTSTAFKALLDLPSGKVPIQSWAYHICPVTYTISV